MVYFEQINLLGRTYHLGPYDLVFCRNVISDFSVPVKTQVLEKIAKQMQEDAFLFLGKGETSLSVTDRFAPVPDTPYLFGVAGGPHAPLKKITKTMVITVIAVLTAATAKKLLIIFVDYFTLRALYWAA